ncbi:hypothetical protein MSAN_00134700 [Mycena sanguinolenta]|uniref:Uncharacterized protein n=1 Tax=Mycena sanguinolenta TaxID=230812 RepID=A0A8H7DN04_9AGAR|nr:hypothetical protein MSAN_00134700 [Mycena sanguinolenta]
MVSLSLREPPTLSNASTRNWLSMNSFCENSSIVALRQSSKRLPSLLCLRPSMDYQPQPNPEFSHSTAWNHESTSLHAAYWSLDPTGVERLSMKEIFGMLTSTPDYEDPTKGFDPDNQDVVRYLGWPLYRLSDGIDAPSARDTDFGMVYASDDESEHSPTSDVGG